MLKPFFILLSNAKTWINKKLGWSWVKLAGRKKNTQTDTNLW